MCTIDTEQLTRRIYNNTRVCVSEQFLTISKTNFHGKRHGKNGNDKLSQHDYDMLLEKTEFKLRLSNSLQVKDAVPDTKLTSITEGSAQIVSESHVFYNPVQQFNRDLSLSVLTAYSRIVQAENKDKLNKNDKANCPSAVSSILKVNHKLYVDICFSFL